MASRLADEREQRRGLILGLTLAEILLLLLFLLLLVLSSQIETWRDRYELLSQSMDELKPLQEALTAGGATDVNSVQELIARFRVLQNSDKEIAKLKVENANLAKESELVRSLGAVSNEKLLDAASAIKRASEIDPSDPPAVLKRALDIIDRLGPSTRPDEVKPLSEMVAGPELEKKLAGLEADLEKTRQQRDNLMRGPGNGLTYPSCWTTPTGQTEYIFDVTLTDTGVQVRNASAGRANDKAWGMVSSFARDTTINESIFIGATKKLFEWSKGQNCRFYTIVRDGTGSSKERYKHLQQMVQGNFYPLYLSPQRKGSDGVVTLPARSANETTPSTPSPAP
jgi:hypothetical protein